MVRSLPLAAIVPADMRVRKHLAIDGTGDNSSDVATHCAICCSKLLNCWRRGSVGWLV